MYSESLQHDQLIHWKSFKLNTSSQKNKNKLQMRSNLRCLLQATNQEILQDPSLHAPKEESTGVLWLNSKGQHLHFLGCDFHYFLLKLPAFPRIMSNVFMVLLPD